MSVTRTTALTRSKVIATLNYDDSIYTMSDVTRFARSARTVTNFGVVRCTVHPALTAPIHAAFIYIGADFAALKLYFL